MTASRESERPHTQAPDRFSQTGAVQWSAVVAVLVACGVPLAQGLLDGWSSARSVAYTAALVGFLALTIGRDIVPSIRRWCATHLWSFLLVGALLAFALQSLSGDLFVQPIVFTVLLVHAAALYSARRTALVALLLLGLVALALWVYGWRTLEAFLIPISAYGALMLFMYAFTRISVEQGLARQRADTLATQLATERDYLRRLIDVTASLTRDMDLPSVLEQVATAGRVLAQADTARVWLTDHSTQPESDPLLLVTTVPHTGAAPPPAQPDASALVLPLISKGMQIGVLELTRNSTTAATADQLRMLQPFANTAAIAITNARLYEQAQMSATLAERNRIARDLHDTIAQGLTAITMQLDAAQKHFERDPERARARLSRAHELARATLGDVRHSVWNLASPLLDGQHLNEALSQQAQQFTARTGIPARYEQHGPLPTLHTSAAVQVLRIIQEALTNVEKHAQASEVIIGTATGTETLHIWVQDNGSGFDTSLLPANGHTNGQGFGLRSLTERARLAGGTTHITSTPGSGTRVEVRIE